MVQYYGMFTEAGNEAIEALIGASRTLELEWPQVLFALKVLARKPQFAEATDTDVRMIVYKALNFESEFYI